MRIDSGIRRTFRRHVPLAFLSCIAAALSLAAQAPPRKAEDEAAIRALVAKYVDAREKPDARAIEALFTSDADQLVSSGEWRKGRAEVVRGTLGSSLNTGGKRTITVESIRFISPDVAIADGRYDIRGLAGGQDRRMWTTLICSRSAGGWLIAAIRNMLPAAPVPSTAR